MNLTYNLKGGKILQNYPSLARICHLFTVVCVLRIVTSRFASKYHFSFCNAPTFRFVGLKVMEQMVVTEYSFCINDMVCLLNNTGCKADNSQVRRIVQDIWKLSPAPNSLTYLTYQIDYNSFRNYSPIKRTGRYYTATKELLTNI